MDGFGWATSAAGAVIGAAVAHALIRTRLRSPARGAMRTNYRGRLVPAVLGAPLVIGALVALALLAPSGVLRVLPERIGRAAIAIALVLVVLYLAGRYDDRRGDERARGFRGHLGALRHGSISSGVVKLGAGAAAGLAAGAVVAERWEIVEVGVLVALSANLLNLLDRAPGRALKVALAAWLILFAVAPASWIVAASGGFGASLACLLPDLKERGMLGDAGANPIGAVLGLGLALTLDRPGRLVAIALLAAANLASERWSYSEIIDRTRLLRMLDRLGRK